MKKDIPEIGDLTQGINDSDIILTHKLPENVGKIIRPPGSDEWYK